MKMEARHKLRDEPPLSYEVDWNAPQSIPHAEISEKICFWTGLLQSVGVVLTY